MDDKKDEVIMYKHTDKGFEIVFGVMTPEQFQAIYNDEDEEYDI